jgi:FlaA1/EpsC-like NDP-sugar epimerase
LITAISFFAYWACFREKLVAMPAYWWVFLLLTLLCTGVFLLVFGCYDSLWKYQESKEYLMQFCALFCGHGLLYGFCRVVLTPAGIEYPQRLQVLVMLISLVAMWMSRFLYRYARQARRRYKHMAHASVKVAIVGAGDAGVSLVDEIRRDPECPYQVVCFFDDDPVKQRAHVRGLPVRGSLDTIADHLKDSDVSEIIVAIPSLDEERTREVLQQCSNTSCRVRILPGIFRA